MEVVEQSSLFVALQKETITKICYLNINLTWKKSRQVIKSTINERKYKPENTKFECNDTIAEDGQVMSNKFTNFFVNICTSAKRFPSSKKGPTEYMVTNSTTHFILDPVYEYEFLKILSNFKYSSAGWDGLKPLIMKNIKRI